VRAAAARWLREDSAELAPELDPVRARAAARAWLEAYAPPDPARARDRDFVLGWLADHPDALLRTCLEGHLTASALVVDAAGARVLLTLHRKLGRWLQLGGHCDGDGNLGSAALREAREESGIAGLVLDARPLDVDVHRIPARPGEPEHWHLDTRFLVRAPRDAVAVLSEESRALRWLAPGAPEVLGSDDSVRRLLELARARGVLDDSGRS